MAVDFTKVPIGTKVETAYGPGHIISNMYHYVIVRVDNVDYHYTPSGNRLYIRQTPHIFPFTFRLADTTAAAARPW